MSIIDAEELDALRAKAATADRMRAKMARMRKALREAQKFFNSPTEWPAVGRANLARLIDEALK